MEEQFQSMLVFFSDFSKHQQHLKATKKILPLMDLLEQLLDACNYVSLNLMESSLDVEILGS